MMLLAEDHVSTAMYGSQGLGTLLISAASVEVDQHILPPTQAKACWLTQSHSGLELFSLISAVKTAGSRQDSQTMHLQGIQSVAWSLHDPSILLSTGHDRRTILWDVPEGELRGELPLQSGPGISVRWSPSHPGLLATASLGAESGDQDGQVGFRLNQPVPHVCMIFSLAGLYCFLVVVLGTW